MPRNISFFATKTQVEDESKDITRRLMAAPIPFEPTSAPDPEIWPAHVI